MTTKKQYIIPQLYVVELKYSSTLLAGSGAEGTDIYGDADGGNETLGRYGGDDDWDE